MSATTMDEAAKLLADPLAYTDERRLHAALTHLRADAPVSWVDVPNYRPFWAITKHADVMDIERENMLFTNWPRPVLTTAEGDEMQAAAGVRTLIHLDDPQHRVVRAIGSDWFRPKAMRALKVRVDELAKVYVDKMMAAGPECDFVQEVASSLCASIIFSPAFRKDATGSRGVEHCLVDPRDLAEWILADNLNVRLGFQIHKFIWEPSLKGV